MNKFTFNILRQFGTENFSFKAESESEKSVLSDDEMKSQLEQIDRAIRNSFIACQEREISEKGLLAEASDRRREAVNKLDEALKREMKQKAQSQLTLQEAEKLNRKLEKISQQ
ncbi:MAG: hypothetical protein KGJ13_09750 [Patescibacteria group bacterium]|nr:hypothetical protein [Patescibacteria group bacterium]